METRTYKEIINEIRDFSSENAQLSDVSKAQLNKCADEIEKKTKDTKFLFFLLLILFFGCSIMWFLLSMENDDLKLDNRNKKSLIESYEKIIRFENDSTRSFTYQTREGNPITYQELMDENLELLNRNSRLEYEIKTKDIYLDVVKKNYGIKVKERNNRIWVESEKVDSALLLLPVYRDKIKYDPQTKNWSVTRQESSGR